ncbi:DUF6382 domain-containing protein [Neobacillus sp. LXY-4]|uniref:DUF6382 domain-containing protein n=1 Tax=Neobacillus sp. LXY-4 TaxID=3379826 RepID=UPI003EDFB408
MIKQVELNIENYGVSTFLTYNTTSLEEVERTELEVMRNSKIPGLMPCTVLKQEDEVCIRYDLISHTTLEMHLNQPVSKKILIQSFSNIAETLIEAQKCNLKIENFVFNPKHIYLDNFSSRLVFIYLPVKNNVFEKVSLRDFLKEIITLAPYDESDDIHFFIKLHNYLLRSAEIEPDELYEMLQEWSELDQPINDTVDHHQNDNFYDALSQPKVSPATNLNPNFYSPGNPSAVNSSINSSVNSAMNTPVNTVKTTINGGVVTSEYSSQKKEKKRNKQLEIEEEVQYKRITRTELGDDNPLMKGGAPLGGTSINIGPNVGGAFIQNTEPEGTTVLGVNREEEEGTTMLGVVGQSTPRPYLLATLLNEKIVITKDVFKIGRDPGQADYVSKNKVVGRVHGVIIMANGEYFFEDNSSRNGSYVNGSKVLPYNRIKIKHDDQIKLANEEFIFKLF